jgi:hypothetical protein
MNGLFRLEKIKFTDSPKLPLQYNNIYKKYESAGKVPELDREDVDNPKIYELDNLLPMYPDQNIQNIQTYVTSKKEYREMGSRQDESIPKIGHFYRHQNFFHRYMYHNDSILNMQKPGTGKTGAGGGLAQKIRRNRKFNETLDYIDKYFSQYNSNIKQVIILVGNKLLQNQFKTQLIYRYSLPGDYDINTLNTKEGSARSKMISRFLKGFFKIITYNKFSNLIQAIKENKDAQIIKDYSDTLFIVDEAHNIRIESTEGLVAKGKEKTRSKTITYNNIFKVFHTALRTKRILMSATPMINDSSEFIDLFNLLLPLDKQLPSSPEDRKKFKTMTLEELEPYYRGMITYVRESGTYINKQYIGTYLVDVINPNEKYTHVVDGVKYKTSQVIDVLGMVNDATDNEGNSLKCQGQIYAENSGYLNIVLDEPEEEAIEHEVHLEETNEDTADNITDDVEVKSRNFFKEAGKLRQICNGIFPDGSFGKKGFDRYIKLDENNGEYYSTDELKAYISNRDFLSILAIKFDRILEILKEDNPYIRLNEFTGEYIATDELKQYINDVNMVSNPALDYKDAMRKIRDTKNFDLKLVDIPGPVYSYTHLKFGSGAIYLGLCLEEHGFTKFSGKQSAFTTNQKIQINPSCTPMMDDQFCDEKELKKVKDEKILFPEFTKKLRYAILTSKLTDTEINNIMALYSSPQNIDGEYLKYLIITPVGREGINLANSMKFILIDPSWNPSSQFQAQSRGFRETSHEDKIRQYRELTGDPTAKLNIKIYNLAAIPESSDSVDKQLYLLTEKKDIEIKIQERYAKILAVDNEINKERNQRVSDKGKEMTGECDYNICEYNTFDPSPDGYVDYSSYDILYSDEVVTEIIEKIKEIFRIYFTINLNHLLAQLSYRKKLIIKALSKIIDEKIILSNRFGQSCYLIEDNGILFTQVDFPINTQGYNEKSYSLNYYNQNLIVQDNKELKDYISDDQIVVQNQVLTTILNKSDQNEIMALLNQLETVNRVKIFETIIIMKYIQGLRYPAIDIIEKYYEKSWLLLKEPLKDIVETSKELSIQSTTKKKSGRKPIMTEVEKPASISPYKAKLPESNEEGKDIIIHLLFGDLENTAAVAVTSNFKNAQGLIRVLKPMDGKWRDVNPAEDIVYRKIFQQNRVDKIRAFESKGIHGTILSDGKFRIVNIKPGTTNEFKDGRKSKRGLVYSSHKIWELAEIMFNLGLDISFIPEVPRVTQYDAYNYLISAGFDKAMMNENNVFYFYQISKSGVTKDFLRPNIFEFLKARGLLLTYES